MNTSTRKILTSALIQGHMDYASVSWYYSIGSTLRHKLQVIQNKMVRFILNMGPRDHIGISELKQVGYLNSKDRVVQLSMNMVHDVFYGNCPEYMKMYFTKVSDVHSHNTRGSNFNFQVPKINSITSTTFYYNAIKEWNALPDNVRGITNKDTFKRVLKSHLNERAFQHEL